MDISCHLQLQGPLSSGQRLALCVVLEWSIPKQFEKVLSILGMLDIYSLHIKHKIFWLFVALDAPCILVIKLIHNESHFYMWHDQMLHEK